MSRYSQSWPEGMIGDLAFPQLWIIRQQLQAALDGSHPVDKLAVVLIDFSATPDDRATFALLGHAWAGASAFRISLNDQVAHDCCAELDDSSQQILGLIVHAPAGTSAQKVQDQICTLKLPRVGVRLLVTSELYMMPTLDFDGIVQSAAGREAVDALSVLQMLFSLASPNERICLDSEDVLSLCSSAIAARDKTVLKLVRATWDECAERVIFDVDSDALHLSKSRSIWLHVDGWRLRGDSIQKIYTAMRELCGDAASMVINAPFCHSVIAPWSGQVARILMLVADS